MNRPDFLSPIRFRNPMDANRTYLHIATFAALLTVCSGRLGTEPAVLLAATPERLDTEKLTTEKLDAESETFFFDVPRPTKVVLWSKFIMKNGQFMERHVPNCTLERAFKHDQPGNRSITIDADYDISDADVVVFNLAPLEQNYVLPRHKPQGQLWVAGCWEPISFDGTDIPGDCSLMNDTATMSQMDGVASYHNSSRFPAFFTPPTEAQLRRPALDFQLSTRRELATYVSSDCRVPWRDGWVSALNRSLVVSGQPGVLSYGTCLRTADEVECNGTEAVEQPAETDDTVEEWVFAKFANRCMARPFALVAENSVSPWYVTEKIWNALATGAIPVYLGPPQVKDLVPPGSVIFAGDYASPEALADALINFNGDDFERARAWKGESTEQWGMWRRARSLSRATLLPRLCAAGAQRSMVEGLSGLSAEDDGESGSPPVVPMLLAENQSVAEVAESRYTGEAQLALDQAGDATADVARSAAAAHRSSEAALDALEASGDPTANVARSTVTSIDDFLRSSDQQEEAAMAFLSRAVSKIRAGKALRRSTHSTVEDLRRDLDDFQESLGVPAQRAANTTIL